MEHVSNLVKINKGMHVSDHIGEKNQDEAHHSAIDIDDKERDWTVSLVVPTMDEAQNIPHVFPKIPPLVNEVVVVDSSKDDTPAVVQRYTPHARIVRCDPTGKGNALRIGIAHATGDYVVLMDADGSMDPGEIPRFIEPLLQGYDAAVGSRTLGSSDDNTLMRQFGNWALAGCVNLLYGTRCTDVTYGYRAYARAALEKITFQSEGFDVETEMTIRMCKAGLSVCEVPSYERPRIHGSSNLRTFRDGWKIFGRIVNERFFRK